MKNSEIAGKVLDMMEKQKFSGWYQKDFDAFIRGEEDAKLKEELLNELDEMLGFSSDQQLLNRTQRRHERYERDCARKQR